MTIGKTESPIVQKTLDRKYTIQKSRVSLSWCFLNLAGASVFYIEILIVNFLTFAHPLVWYIEWLFAVHFSFNTLVNVLRYFLPSLTSSPVELNPHQKVLLGVKDSDVGFRVLGSLKKSPHTEANGTIHFSPSSTLASPGSTPGNRSGSSLGHVTALSPGSPSYVTSSPGYMTSSPGYTTFSPGSYGTPTYQIGGSYIGSQSSCYSPISRPPSGNQSSLSTPMDSSGLRSRSRNSPARTAALSSEECISNMASLDQYLQDQEEKEHKAQIAAESSPSSGPSYWTWNRSATDYSPILRKFQYQIASRSPTSKMGVRSNDDDPDIPSKYMGDEVWSRMGVFREDVDFWTENLRKWLSQTIMFRLVQEIENINSTLRKIGCEDMEIGEVSISTLKQIATTKCQHVPSLTRLVPYLECHSNQEYLIHRIKELGKTGCMSDFNWNGGMEYKGKQWKAHLPTDCQIVMHCLCTYFDCHLPPHPKYPDGKTFTTQHFLKTPDKPNSTKKDNLVLYQSKINPPHYKVILEDDIWDVNKGRNNMFHAILLFLHHIKSKECGMLGRVNLGMSGLNLLWILDKK